MQTVKLLALILFLILVIIFAPLISIWSLNTLFGLGIAYTIWTWAATIWLQGIALGGFAASAKK